MKLQDYIQSIEKMDKQKDKGVLGPATCSAADSMEQALKHLNHSLSINPYERSGCDYTTGFANGVRYGLLQGIEAIESQQQNSIIMLQGVHAVVHGCSL